MLAASVICLLTVPAATADGSSSSAASTQPAADAAALGTYSAQRFVEMRTGRNHPVGARAECSYKQHRALGHAVRFYSRRLNEWNKMGAGSEFATAAARTPKRAQCPRYFAAVLKRKAASARRAYARWFRATYEKYRCLHEHEGAWNANTSNGYWGGLQFDWGFQHTYGPEFIRRYGLAHRWPVFAQLIAAERAFYGFSGFGGRGYSPWGTRGRCGL